MTAGGLREQLVDVNHPVMLDQAWWELAFALDTGSIERIRVAYDAACLSLDAAESPERTPGWDSDTWIDFSNMIGNAENQLGLADNNQMEGEQ
jgi:hypothetical protein